MNTEKKDFLWLDSTRSRYSLIPNNHALPSEDSIFNLR